MYGWLRKDDAGRQLPALLLLAVLLRGAVLWFQPAAMDADPDAYRTLAVTLAQHGVFGTVDSEGVAHPTAFRPPLYSWLLSWLVVEDQLPSGRVALLHLALGVATVLGTYLLGRRLIGRAAWLAALLVLVDPVLLVQSTQVMTETLAVALAVGAWLAWVWLCDRLTLRGRWYSAAGVFAALLALAFLCRPTFIVWAALLCGSLVLWAAVRRVWQPVAACVVVLAVLGITVGLWTERNRRAVGHPVWATSHGGYTLLLGNNPLFYQYLRSPQRGFGSAWDAEPFHRAWARRVDGDPLAADFWQRTVAEPVAPPRVEDEVADDQAAYQAARQTIAREPRMFCYSVLVRIGRLWSPIPQTTAERGSASVAAVAVVYLLWWAALAGGVWRLGRRLWSAPWAAGLLLAVSLTAVHAVYWSNLRMRAPAVPWLALVAAGALAGRANAAPKGNAGQEGEPPGH